LAFSINIESVWGRDVSGVHDQQQDVDALHRGGDFVHHLAAKRRVRVVQSGRVDEHNLAALLRDDALDAVSCGFAAWM